MSDELHSAANIMVSLLPDKNTPRVKKRVNVIDAGSKTEVLTCTAVAVECKKKSRVKKEANTLPNGMKIMRSIKDSKKKKKGEPMGKWATKTVLTDGPVDLNPHLPFEMPDFQKLARGGGNFKTAGVSKTRTLEVPLDDNNLLKYQPNPRYTRLMKELRDFAEKHCSLNKEGVVHPYLGFQTAEMETELVQKFAPQMFNNVQTPKKIFSQFLCTIAVRSKTFGKKGSIQRTTWTFDPHSWNAKSYRMTPGGDMKGGRPKILVCPPDI
jgi:hypothetical protein